MKKSPKIHFTIYLDRRHEWRWHAKRCGRIVAESGEGYTRKASLLRTLDRFVSAIIGGKIVFA